MQKITGLIYNWFNYNCRDLPWRETSDPYAIWVSETILQQTQVNQGLPYYYRFLKKFPDIKSLAEASGDDVMKTWEGLGYYSRARHMQEAAQTILKEYGGCFPETYREIRKLKGIGPYTAAAVSSIAFGLPYAVTDGNVSRVIARYLGITQPVDSSGGMKIIGQIAQDILDVKNPGFHNQAMMEFGALCCLPRNPDCLSCPLCSGCSAFRHNLTGVLPVKKNVLSRKVRFFYFYIPENDEKTLIEKRTGKDIWKNLYQFPLYESDHELSENEILTNSFYQQLICDTPSAVLEISPVYIHELTHQQIRARFVRVYHQNIIRATEAQEVVCKEEIYKFAFPVLIRNFVNEKFTGMSPEN